MEIRAFALARGCLVLMALTVVGCSNPLNPLNVQREITIKVRASGNGIGRVIGPTATRINCSVTKGSAGFGCEASFVDAGAGGIFALEAVADTTSTFEGFSGDCSGAVCNLSFPQGSDTTFNVTARFLLLPPIVRIEAPLDNASIPSTSPTGARVQFRAAGMDRSGDNLNSFWWVSNLQGALCTPAGPNGCGQFMEDLTPGLHTITATVADQEGTQSSASITVTVIPPGNFPPEAEIVTPTSGDTVPGDQPVRFGGLGRDQEDGALPDPALTWTSSVTGVLGIGSNISVMMIPGSGGEYAFAQLPPGIYTISVSVPLNITFPSPVQMVVLMAGQNLVVNFAGFY